MTYMTSDTPWVISRHSCVIIYTVINVAMIIVVLIRCATFVSVFIGTSMNLHTRMFNAITRATMYFFNTNSSGTKFYKLLIKYKLTCFNKYLFFIRTDSEPLH